MSNTPRLPPGARGPSRPAVPPQRYKLGFTPYRARGFFLPTLSGAGPFAYLIKAGTAIELFSCAVGDDMALCGARGVQATYADSMLQTRNKTKANQRVVIRGIAIQANPRTHIALARAAWAELSVFLSLNGGENKIYLGQLADLPGGSSLYGADVDTTRLPALPGQEPLRGFISNGLPGVQNHGAMGDGVIWRPDSDKQGDTSLAIIVEAQRDITITAPADVAGGAGVQAYTHPEPGSVSGGAVVGEVLLDLSCRLFGVVDGPRSTVI
jgi:hypothetical protein